MTTQAQFDVAMMMDAIAGAMASAGMCDVGTYAVSIDAQQGAPGRIFVDRDVQLYGPQGQVINAQIKLTFVRADFAVAIDVGGVARIGAETFTIDSIAGSDNAAVVAVCPRSST